MSAPSLVRYAFRQFVLSPGHRVLLRNGEAVPLIPRYFDLLVLLVAERHRAVTRVEIFDRVWADVVVSDGALTQAIRTIRRALSDGPEAVQFIRTVSRHGYQFVGEVVEGPDDGPLVAASGAPAPQGEAPRPMPPEERDRLVTVLLGTASSAPVSEEDRYEAALVLHELGTDEALRRIDKQPGEADARAILRDARWEVPGAGDVPLLSARARVAAIAGLVLLRLRHGALYASARWMSAIFSSAVGGMVAGTVGGVALSLAASSRVDSGVTLALVIVGAAAGALGGAGIGGGLAAAEMLARSARSSMLVVGAAAGGWLAGTAARVGTRALVASVFGRHVPGMAGGLEGLVVGGVLGLGFALATRNLVSGGMAAPRGAARVRVALVTGAATACAGLALSLAGRKMVASTLDLVASGFAGSHVGLSPLALFLGGDQLRPVTQTLVSAFEGLTLGASVAFGLTRRPSRSTRET